jgi:hypothetical protein
MPRRPASPAVIVVLAALGALVASVAGVGAYTGVSRYLDNRSSPSGPGPSGQSSALPAPPCPDPTIQAVKAEGRPGNLVMVVYVRGTTQNEPEPLDGQVWICRDSGDGERLYLHHQDIGGVRPGEGDDLTFIGVQGEVNVEQTSGGGLIFVATRGNLTMRVSCAQGGQEFRVVGGTEWSTTTCLEGDALRDAPTTLAPRSRR